MGKTDTHVWYKQYQQLKAQHPGTILLYRLGDFYEVFDDDAKLVAELLDVTLTRKDYAIDKSTKEKLFCPMAGMPYHAVESYVARLVNQGYRIAIAEQMSETASSKSDTRPRSPFAAGLSQTGKQRGLVHREVVRVITPGTIIDPTMLPAGENNYLAAVIADGERIGLSYADLTTGEFAATEMSGERAAAHIEGELARLAVSEVLVPEDNHHQLDGLTPTSAHLTHDLAPMTKEEREHLLPHERVARRLEQKNTARWQHGHVTARPAWQWEHKTAKETLLFQLGVQSLAGFGLDDKPLATRAAGAILHYINETQRGVATQITSIRVYTTGSFMFLDPQTRRNLELLESSDGKSSGTVRRTLDYTRTPMGARLLRRWLSQPLLELEALQRRQDAVACCVQDTMMRADLRKTLGETGDMERAVSRIIQGATVATPRDLVQLRQALRSLPAIIAAIGKHDPLLQIGKHDWHSTDTHKRIRRDGAMPIPPAPPTDPQSNTRNVTKLIQETRDSPPPRVEGDDLFGDDDDNDDDDVQLPASPAPVPIQDEGETADTLSPDGGGRARDGAKAQGETADTLPPDSGGRARDGAKAQGETAAVLDPCSAALALLERALDDDPPALLGASNYLRADGEGDNARRVIRPGYDQRIDRVVSASHDAQHYINTLESRERERTGIKSLKVDYNKVFGYYLEVSRNYSHQVPSHYERKQTLVNTERYITAELKEYESIILNAQQRIVEYERETFMAICQQLEQHASRLRAAADTLARLDVVASLAEAAVRGNYIRPTLNESTDLRITGGRHPVVERGLEEAFVPNNTHVDTEKEQILVITGPNMAGKSTVLRQVALIVLMAQIGSFVPAEAAEVGLVDRIFSRIGAQDDIATGRSTFMVEMTETAALLTQSTRKSLIILDEVGRGTSTYDGMAIARAVIEYIHNEPRLQCRTLFATHYHELTDLETLLPRVENYHMAAIEQAGHVVFLYELRKGGADRSYGIHVAELAGIPRPVIHRASELLAELECKEKDSFPAPVNTAQPDEPNAGEEDADKQLSLFDAAPHPVVEYIKRLNINDLTPIEAMTRLYELQKLANTPL